VAPGSLQVRNHLCLMDGREGVDRFKLNQQLPVDHKIQPALSYLTPLITQRERLLPDIRNPAKVEFDGQRLFVDAFKIPWPQITMHFNRCSDYCASQPVQPFAWFDLGVHRVLAV